MRSLYFPGSDTSLWQGRVAFSVAYGDGRHRPQDRPDSLACNACNCMKVSRMKVLRRRGLEINLQREARVNSSERFQITTYGTGSSTLAYHQSRCHPRYAVRSEKGMSYSTYSGVASFSLSSEEFELRTGCTLPPFPSFCMFTNSWSSA